MQSLNSQPTTVEAIRTVIAVDRAVRRDLLENALPDEVDLEIVAVLDGLDKGWKTLGDVANDLVIIAASGYSDHAVALIEKAVSEQPARPVVVLSEASPNGHLRRLFEAGADDVVTLPESRDVVLFAVRKAVARKQGTAVTKKLSPLVCLFGPKGGTGKTILATNIAVSLASGGHDVTLVDLDLQFGDVGLALGLAPEHTIYELARSAGTLDSEKLSAYITRHQSGLGVLLAPTRPDQAAAVTQDFLQGLYGVLRSSSDVVVVDTPPGVSPEVITTIENSSEVIVALTPDPLALKAAKLALERLGLLHYQQNKIHLVLARTGARDAVSDDDVREILGRAPDTVIPGDPDVPRSLQEGRAVVESRPKSEAALALRGLADRYAVAAKPATPRAQVQRRRLFGRAG
jgi:pilus assembly protein CpaE